MLFYHVTSLKNLDTIKTQGLIPRKDKRGQGFEETPPAVYLFNTLDEAMDGASNWLGDCFDDGDQLVLLTIKLDLDQVEPDPELPSSCSLCLKTILPEQIIEINENF